MAVDTRYLITFTNGTRPDAKTVFDRAFEVGLTATPDVTSIVSHERSLTRGILR